MKTNSHNAGWTLFETMVGIAIIALVVVIFSVPNFVKASHERACHRNLEKIYRAQKMWDRDHGDGENSRNPTMAGLVGPYLPKELTCPAGGIYNIETLACSIHGKIDVLKK